MAVLFISLFLRSLFRRKKSIPETLFETALKQENNGHYDEALVNYTNALEEARKIKHNRGLQASILEKIKTLHTVIKYHKHFSTALPVPLRGHLFTVLN
jgi:hypothetical protein